MVSEYIIPKNTNVKNYLILRHISNKVINQLFSNYAITDENRVLKPLDTFDFDKKIYVNYSLIESNDDQKGNDKLDISNDIIYETTELIAIDKKNDILIHSDGNTDNTILNSIVRYLKQKGDDSYIRCLHRLDVKTSGICLFAKNIVSYQEISYQLESQEVYKRYIALAKGHLHGKQTVNIKIGKNRHESNVYIVSKTGKDTTSIVTPIKYINNNTIVSVEIKTGRTHQIRVTLSYMGHPIIGDKLYDRRAKGNRLELISKEMRFILDGKEITLESKQEVRV